MAEHLPSWNDTETRAAIVAWMWSIEDADVPDEDRVAVFDNDGTLWIEKPVPNQLVYALQRFAARAASDPSVADTQPYAAAASGDMTWIDDAIKKHYKGDDADLGTIITALTQVTDGMSVEDYAASVAEFARTAVHPVLKVPFAQTVYRPMVELIRYLEEHRFTCYISSAGERDFMRPFVGEAYGLAPHRVIGSEFELHYDAATGDVRYKPSLDHYDDGDRKPVAIWSRVGRRPLLAAGNADGDLPMLEYARRGSRPALCLLVNHDDDTGRGDPPYGGRGSEALGAATERGYVVVSVKNDWSRVFGTS